MFYMLTNVNYKLFILNSVKCCRLVYNKLLVQKYIDKELK
jgi:hypothetical protein